MIRSTRPYLVAGYLAAALVAGCASGGSAVSSPFGGPGPSPSPSGSAMPSASPSASPSTSPSTSPSAFPSPTPTPIQLTIGGVVGTQQGWPDDDTAAGGQGQAVDGINCRVELLNSFHHHVHLSVFYNGAQLEIPKGTGMYKPGSGTSGFIYHAQCFYFIHTHDRTGIIHVEPPDGSITFTLKNWFDVWGEPLSTTNVGGYTGNVAVYINGMLQPGMDPNTIVFSPFEEITLVIGTPPSWIPQYLFPPDYT